MWWPRPRWKCDYLSARFVLLFIATRATTAMADDEGEQRRCDDSGNASATVIWTTALCTALLIFAVVAVYFVYCKRREHDWSSLWWKNNPDKNIVLQTSSPTKSRRQIIGGTDNPSFTADSNVDDCVTTGRSTTKIVRVPSSSAGNGLTGIDLSVQVAEDGRRTYACGHDDGPKDRLVALRLVFDQEDTQRRFGQLSDLNRSLAELIRDHGLRVELETEAVNVSAPCGVTATAGNDGGNQETDGCAVKSNIFTAVRGTAQRLWNQKRLVFKGSGDNNNCGDDRRGQHADNEPDCGTADVESGHGPSAAAATVNITAQPSCSAVTVVNETVQKSAADGLQYRTLEYGASPADMDEGRSSPECSIQCGTVINAPEPAAVTATVAAVPAAENAASTPDDCSAAQVPVDDDGDTAAAVTVDGDDAQNHGKPNVDIDGPPNKPAAANPPPPPPPRKYYASAVPPAPATVTCTPHAAAETPQQIDNHSSANTPEKAPRPSSPPSKNNEIAAVAPDDYYWCTTTAMAPPVLSTFGKRLSAGPAGDENAGDENTSSVADMNVAEAEKTVTCNGVTVAEGSSSREPHVDGPSNNTASGAVTTTTTSIEDTSLPSFSSDEDDDDNGVFAEKTRSPGSAVADKDALDECNPTADTGPAGKRTGVCKEDAVVKVTGDDRAAVTSPEPKSPTTKLPTLRLHSSPPVANNNNTTYFGTSSGSSSSSSSSSPSSPTNHGSSNNNNTSPIVSKIPVRRQSAGSAVTSPLTNGTGKKSIPLPLSRSGSRLAMWSTVN